MIDGIFSTKLYDKRYDNAFRTGNIPDICSNIPELPHFGIISLNLKDTLEFVLYVVSL